MPYSYTLLEGDGSTTTFGFSFPYLDQSHIHVKVDEVVTAFSWLTSSTISISPAPADEAVIEIRRITPKDEPPVNFTDGSTLLEADLDALALFNLYCAQEAQDGVDASITQNSLGKWDGQGRVATNFADPEGPTDLVTKGYFDDVYQPQLDAAVDQAENARDAAQGYAAAADSSADAAAAMLGVFRGQYLGAHATAPIVDGNGAALTAGDLYFDTTTEAMRVYTGVVWVNAGSTVAGTINTPTSPVVAVGGETSVPVPGGYDSGFITVFVNGTKWDSPDIDISSGTDIEFLVPLSASDEVSWVAYGAFQVADINAADVSFQLTGTDTVVRTVHGRLSDVLSVKDYGALGDGVADDSAAINKAEADASLLGRSVYFPRGTYRCASSLYRRGNTDWVGEGMYASIIKHSGGVATHHLVTVPDFDESYDHIGFYGLGFDGNRSGSSDPDAARVTIYLSRSGEGGVSSPSKDIRVNDCRVFNFSFGGSGMNLSGYTGVKVLNCDIRDGGGGLIHCIYIRRCADVVVTGNTCIGQDGNTSIKVQLSPKSTISHNVVGGGNHGINAQDSDQTTIVGNTASDCTDSAIAVTIETLPAASNATIVGNTVMNSLVCVEVNNANTVSITGNIFREFKANGVYMRSVQDFAISGNVFRTADVSLSNCRFIEFNSGPSASRGIASGNRMISSRGAGNTAAFWTDEASTSNLLISGNSYSNSGWSNQFDGIRPLTKFEPTAAAPSSPSKGDTYFDSTLDKLRTWNGATWNNLF